MMKKIISIVMTFSSAFSIITASGTTIDETAEKQDEYRAELFAITDPKIKEVTECIRQGVLDMDEEIFLERFGIDSETLYICFRALRINYPDMYFINESYGGTVSRDGVIESVIPEYNMSREEIGEKQRMVDAETEKILETIEPGMNRFDKIAAVNNYFANHYGYDYEHLNNSEYLKKYTMPGLFETGKAAAEGFSLAFKYVMDRLDIPCTTVWSPSMQHLWNLVQAKEDSENWYNIDVTWDTIYFGEYERSPFTFFLKSDYRFQNMHEKENFGEGQDHVDYQPDGWANDESMNDIAITNTGTAPVYLDGYWYYGKQKLSYWEHDTIMRYNSATGESEVVVSVNDDWTVPAGTYSKDRFCWNSVGVYDNKLYYNDSLNIYVYDPEIGASRVFRSKPAGVVEGKTPIFEVRVEGDKLIYVTAADYPGSGSVASEYSIDLSEEPYYTPAPKPLVDGGICGDNALWEYYSDGELVISGDGDMYDYSDVNAPWYGYRSDILSVEISEGITSIGGYAFWGGTNITRVLLPESVTSIGTGAFRNCSKLASIMIPASVTEIKNMAFTGCADGFTIYGYSGSAAETYAANNKIKFVSLGSAADHVILSADKDNNTVELSKPAEGRLMSAMYDAEGRLSEFEIRRTDLESRYYELSMQNHNDSEICVMLWDNDVIKPKADAVFIK